MRRLRERASVIRKVTLLLSIREVGRQPREVRRHLGLPFIRRRHIRRRQVVDRHPLVALQPPTLPPLNPAALGMRLVRRHRPHVLPVKKTAAIRNE
jgi:hypothetical protein